MITPEQLATGSEHGEQAAVFQAVAIWGTKLYPAMSLLFAVPNGADYGGNRVAGARMRAEGLKPGVPDMFWPYPAGGYCGLWVELKKPGAHNKKNGDRSDHQVGWHQNLRSLGWPVVTAYGWEAAYRTLLLYARGALRMEGCPDGLFLYKGCLQLPELPREQW